MTAISLTAAREALANYLAANITTLRAVTTRFGNINPPCAVVVPVQGTFGTYQVTMDGQVDWTLRVIIIVSAADSESGQDELDPYLSVTDGQSVWATVNADPTLGGAINGFCVVTEATGYGIENIGGVDYLGASVIVEFGF